MERSRSGTLLHKGVGILPTWRTWSVITAVVNVDVDDDVLAEAARLLGTTTKEHTISTVPYNRRPRGPRR